MGLMGIYPELFGRQKSDLKEAAGRLQGLFQPAKKSFMETSAHEQWKKRALGLFLPGVYRIDYPPGN